MPAGRFSLASAFGIGVAQERFRSSWPSDIAGKAAQKSRLDLLTGCVHARFGGVQSSGHVAAHGLRPGNLPPDRRPPLGVRPVPARRRVGSPVI